MQYIGPGTYVLYENYQRRLTSWLVESAARLGLEPEATTVERPGESIVTFEHLYHLTWGFFAHGGMVTSDMLYYANYISRKRLKWDPRLEQKSLTRTILASTEEAERSAWLNAKRFFSAFANLMQSAPVRHNAFYPHPQITYTLPTVPGEAFFAWVTFFDDLCVIRETLREYWRNYRHSFDTLTTVTLLTNTAIRMIRKNCDSLIRMTQHYPDMPSEYTITEWIFQGTTGSFSPDHQFYLSGLQHNKAIWCCYEAKFALSRRLPGLDAHAGVVHVDQYQWRYCKKYFGGRLGDGARRERYVGEYVRLLRLSLHNLREFHDRATEKDDPTFLPCYDEITHGWLRWESYLNFSRVPLWLVVAFQILVDIRGVLENYFPTALDDLKEYADETHVLFRKNEGHPMAQRMATDKQYWVDLPRDIERCIKGDNFAKKAAKLSDDTTSQNLDGGADFFLLTTNPLLCGMQSWWMEHMQWSFASSRVKLHEAIMPAAILYVLMRDLKLVDAWHDMDFVIRTRGTELILCLESFKSSLTTIDEPPGLSKLCPTSRYLANLFQCYAAHETFTPQLGVPKETLDEVINRLYNFDGLRVQMKSVVCNNDGSDVFWSLKVVAEACHHDEELASFDWFNMHDTCQKFFDIFRQTLEPSMSTNFSLIDKGLDFGPYNHASKNSASLDALYYLVYGDDTSSCHENFILAVLCHKASHLSYCKISKREYMTKRWAVGIRWHAANNGICLENAADTLQHRIIEVEGEVNTAASAARLWKRQRLRAVAIPGARRYHCPNRSYLHRNATESDQPEGWDRYHEFYHDSTAVGQQSPTNSAGESN